jgi:hypothetical protein
VAPKAATSNARMIVSRFRAKFALLPTITAEPECPLKRAWPLNG